MKNKLPIFQIKQFVEDFQDLKSKDTKQLAKLIVFMDKESIEYDFKPLIQFNGWETKDKKHYRLKE